MGVLGDSQTASTLYGNWPSDLVGGLNTDYADTMKFTPENPVLAHSGYDIGEAAAAIDADLASHSFSSDVHQYIFFINYGIVRADDETEANFKSNYQYVIDALQAKFPGCIIFLTYPAAGTVPTRHAIIEPWIDTLIAGETNVYAGDDESVWLEGGDDFATNTYDGVHYSAAGHAAKVIALRARTLAVLGW